VRDLSVWATGGLLPALTVLLDLDASAASQRRNTTGEAPDRLEREKIDFFEATRAQYLKLAEAEPERFLVLDAQASVDELQSQIRSRIEQLLGA
jgi:dTMP kinase